MFSRNTCTLKFWRSQYILVSLKLVFNVERKTATNYFSVMTLIFYGGFYLGLLFIFTVLLGFFTLILDEITPHWMGEEAPMQNMPGTAL